MNGGRVCGLLAVVLTALGAHASPYRVERFHADYRLFPDGRLQVSERITVRFEEPRRGIVRFIPVIYDTGRGVNRRILLGGITVHDEQGEPLTTLVRREGPAVTIRIGDEDVWLPAGTRKTYVIDYSAKGVVNWPRSDDGWESAAELYWNVTGDEWDAVIERASFEVRFSTEVPPERVRARVFVGPLGSTRGVLRSGPGQSESVRDGVRIAIEPGRFTGSTWVALGPGEGLTLVLQLPADAVAKPGPGLFLALWVWPNLGFGIPLLVLVVMLPLYRMHGRDRRLGPIAVQFEPPDGLSPAEMGTLNDEHVDRRDVAATLIELAVRGYLVLSTEHVGTLFRKPTTTLRLTEKEIEAGLPEFERRVLEILGTIPPPITPSDLQHHLGARMSELENFVYRALVERGYYPADPKRVRAAWSFGSLVGVFGLAVLAAVAAPFGNIAPAIVGGMVGLPVALVLASKMPKRTRAGDRALEKVRGFEEFLRRARADFMRWQAKRDRDASLFEEYLPYAVAFGCVEEWAGAFGDVVSAPPSWYRADPAAPFLYRNFVADLSTVADDLGRVSTTPPRSAGASSGSSGFGGGGFSGGGFGGGGGRSW